MSNPDDIEETEPLVPYEGVFTDIFNAVSIPPRWIIKDVLPPGMVFLAADPKAGKSTMTMALAALVAGYQCKALPTWMSKVEQPGPVMAFSAEGLAGELRYLLEEGLGVTGEPDGGILVADDPWEFRLDNEQGTSRFLQWLNNRKPKLVILDPLRNFHSADENDSAEMYALLRPLRQWAIAEESSMVVVHHTRKLSEQEDSVAVERMRGTSAMFGMVDGALILGNAAHGGMRCTDISATFKRATPWRRQITVASYGRKGERASEVLDAYDRGVIQAVTEGKCITLTEVATKMNMKPEKIRPSIEKVVRNGWIEGVLYE